MKNLLLVQFLRKYINKTGAMSKPISLHQSQIDELDRYNYIIWRDGRPFFETQELKIYKGDPND